LVNKTYCSFLTVKSGIITDILDTNVNIGGVKTSGFDLAAHYKFPSTSVGDFKLGLDWTFLKIYDSIQPDSSSTTGFTTIQEAGTTTTTGGFPKQRANASLNWNYGDWSAAWNMEYIHSMYEGCTATDIREAFCSFPGPLSPEKTYNHNYNYLGATIYHDVTATYHFDDWNTDFTLGIRNLFDKEPPTAETAFANSFLPAFYRVPGREFYGRISVKF
jgi:iron complex outermembrane receptor protein